LTHDWERLDPPSVMEWLGWAGLGPRPIPVKRATAFDRRCRRCGLLLQEGTGPESLAESWRDCDLALVRLVMES
jgi:hypothetical protein